MDKKTLIQPFALRLARFFVQRPWLLISCVVLYVVVPVDLVPEVFLGPIGYLDDLFVMLLPLVLREFVKKHDPKEIPNE